MKRFLAVFLGSKASMARWDELPKKTRERREAEGMAAWQAWVKKHAKAIVEPGAPLGPTIRVDRRGASKTRNDLCVYTVVEARTHAAAAKIFLDHPHFTIFPGDAVEVVECLPVPGE